MVGKFSSLSLFCNFTHIELHGYVSPCEYSRSYTYASFTSNVSLTYFRRLMASTSDNQTQFSLPDHPQYAICQHHNPSLSHSVAFHLPDFTVGWRTLISIMQSLKTCQSRILLMFLSPSPYLFCKVPARAIDVEEFLNLIRYSNHDIKRVFFKLCSIKQ